MSHLGPLSLAQLTGSDLGVVIVGLLFFLILYLACKFAWPRDYGIPVRRRLLVASLRVDRDQVAYVPIWWSHRQVQRAVRAHWKESLRRSCPVPAQAADGTPAGSRLPA